MMWYWWLLVIVVIFIVCIGLGAYWWKKWHEMMLRLEYAVVGFFLGALVMFVLVLIVELVW